MRETMVLEVRFTLSTRHYLANSNKIWSPGHGSPVKPSQCAEGKMLVNREPHQDRSELAFPMMLKTMVTLRHGDP